MTWLKVGDSAFTDAVFAALPATAWRLHLTAVWYILRSNGGDPVIPRTALRHLGPRANRARNVQRLIADGLWERVDWTPAGVPGYRVIASMEDQPSMEEVARQREFNATRQARSRRHGSGDHSMCSPEHCAVLRRPRPPLAVVGSMGEQEHE